MIDDFVNPGDYLEFLLNPKVDYEHLFGEKKFSYTLGGFYYTQPSSAIDKIVCIKKYRDINKFGTAKEDDYTGEEEEYVLDLHNFDEKLYKMFLEHQILEITWED